MTPFFTASICKSLFTVGISLFVFFVPAESQNSIVPKKAFYPRKIWRIQGMLDGIQDMQKSEFYHGKKDPPSLDDGVNYEEHKPIFMMYYVSQGRIDDARQLLETDPQVVKKWVAQSFLRPPLLVATLADKNNVDSETTKAMIHLLVTNDAPLDQMDDRFGVSGIHVASALGKTAALSAIIREGADIHQLSLKGSCLAIHFAAAGCPPNVEEVTTILLEAAGLNAETYLYTEDGTGKHSIHLAHTRRCTGFFKAANKFIGKSDFVGNKL